jgi:hypothetical protein
LELQRNRVPSSGLPVVPAALRRRLDGRG